jgi:hypothetical protein
MILALGIIHVLLWMKLGRLFVSRLVVREDPEINHYNSILGDTVILVENVVRCVVSNSVCRRWHQSKDLLDASSHVWAV